jgi:hypothetical protein
MLHYPFIALSRFLWSACHWFVRYINTREFSAAFAAVTVSVVWLRSAVQHILSVTALLVIPGGDSLVGSTWWRTLNQPGSARFCKRVRGVATWKSCSSPCAVRGSYLFVLHSALLSCFLSTFPPVFFRLFSEWRFSLPPPIIHSSSNGAVTPGQESRPIWHYDKHKVEPWLVNRLLKIISNSRRILPRSKQRGEECYINWSLTL